VPSLTVIIPCFNAEKYIEQCLVSVVNQTLPKYEIIFVDNESTDDSLQKVENLVKNLRLEKHVKIFTAPNTKPYSWDEPVYKALENSSGEVFTIIGADDYIAPSYLENSLVFMEGSGSRAIQSNIATIVPNGAGFATSKEVQHSYQDLEEFKRKLFIGCPVNTPTVFYKREDWESGLIEWDSDQYSGAADYNLYFKLADAGVFIRPANRCLGYVYRWHSTQATWGMVNEAKKGNVFDHKIQDYWKKQWKL